jgi:hypothetical protein
MILLSLAASILSPTPSKGGNEVAARRCGAAADCLACLRQRLAIARTTAPCRMPEIKTPHVH